MRFVIKCKVKDLKEALTKVWYIEKAKQNGKENRNDKS